MKWRVEQTAARRGMPVIKDEAGRTVCTFPWQSENRHGHAEEIVEAHNNVHEVRAERIASLEAENAALRRAIMGREPDPSVSHGQFLEMARTLHDACDGGRIRAEAAEAALARLRVLAQNQGVMDANEITRLEAALSAERKKVERLGKALKKIEYVLQKDSLTQAERISSAFSVVRAALDEAAPSALDKERQT